jgi:hypothetical protein
LEVKEVIEVNEVKEIKGKNEEIYYDALCNG